MLVSTPPHVFAKVPLDALHGESGAEARLNQARQSPCSIIGIPGRRKERRAEDRRMVLVGISLRARREGASQARSEQRAEEE